MSIAGEYSMVCRSVGESLRNRGDNCNKLSAYEQNLNHVYKLGRYEFNRFIFHLLSYNKV